MKISEYKFIKKYEFFINLTNIKKNSLFRKTFVRFRFETDLVSVFLRN